MEQQHCRSLRWDQGAPVRRKLRSGEHTPSECAAPCQPPNHGSSPFDANTSLLLTLWKEVNSTYRVTLHYICLQGSLCLLEGRNHVFSHTHNLLLRPNFHLSPSIPGRYPSDVVLGSVTYSSFSFSYLPLQEFFQS